MHKIILLIALLFLLSSCGTYTGQGAYTGSALGSIIGSAIGGISNGHRGSDVGTLVGMAGGAVVGGAVGSQMDKRHSVSNQYEQLHRYDSDNYDSQVMDTSDTGKNALKDKTERHSYDNVYDSSGSGDDCLYDFNVNGYTDDYSATNAGKQIRHTSSVDKIVSDYGNMPRIEIRNALFVDANRDNIINRGELCKVIFEVFNEGKKTIYDILPMVYDATENPHLQISPSVHVECLSPGQGIRYTALVKADRRLKKGEVRINLSVLHSGRTVSKVSEIKIVTGK